MNVAQHYLRLDHAYCEYLGGLRWSATGDALEYATGETFAFVEEIALFLEGFAGTRPLIHFGFLLHLLELLRPARRTLTPECFRLCTALREAGGSLRNAGAFCAVLCRNVPEVPQAVEVRQVGEHLRQPFSWLPSGVAFRLDCTEPPAEQPPIGPAALEQQFLQASQSYSAEELKHWFRHGEGPIHGVGGAIARRLPERRSLAGVLGALLERPRFAGSRHLVAQLFGALILPPRCLARQELPVGGYADVTTHGQLDQVLPSQFALDEWDFYRRLAENELLFFRREEPHAQSRQERVVLLDQGVRTWGTVRLILSAAVLALGKQAARRRLPFLVATTSSAGEPVDPLQMNDEELGQLVEASDLSANPGLALEGVLEQAAAGMRDVILLTHPRNLREPDVQAAARRVLPGTRLFTVAVEAGGRVSFSEMRQGIALEIQHFQLGLAPPPTQPALAKPSVGGEAKGQWQGDVEPIPFPFRFGIGDSIGQDLFDFDYAGDWLLTASQGGILHRWKTDGSEMEVLPRGMWRGGVLTRVEAIVGVAGGFVVAGCIENRLVAMHYVLAHRVCIAHSLGEARAVHWGYSRRHHVLLAYTSVRNVADGHALDLTSGLCFSPRIGEGPSRAREAWEALEWNEVPERTLSVAYSAIKDNVHASPSSCTLDPGSGELQLQKALWRKCFTPLANGRPALKGSLVLEAQCQGLTLALKTRRAADKGNSKLRLFRGPEGIPWSEFALSQERGFVLSADGRLLARQVQERQLEVRTLGEAAAQRFLTRKVRFDEHVQLSLGEMWLILHVGKHVHTIRWDRGRLEFQHTMTIPREFQGPRIAESPRRRTPVPGTTRGIPDVLKYDPQRFLLGAETDIIVVVDRFGQAVILDRQHRLVCMFFAFRGQLSGWMPDGTHFNPATFLGGPPTPDAELKIGQALWAASERGRSVP